MLSLPDGGGGSEAISIGALAVWWAVIVGLAVGGWPRAEVPRPGLVGGVCLAGLALLTLLSLGWAYDDGKAFIEFVRVSGYLGLFVLVLISSPRGGSRSWLNGLAIGLVVVAALALGSRLVGWLPGSREASALLPADRGRLSYPIGYWNGLAAAMAAGVLLVAWLGSAAASARARTAAIAAMPVLALTLFLTSSRGGMGAALIGLIVLVAFAPRRAPLLAGLAIGGAGAGILIGIAATMSELLDRPSAPASVGQGHLLLAAVFVVVVIVAVFRYLADEGIGTARLPRVPLRPALAVGGVILVVAIVLANPVAKWNNFKSPPDLPKPGSATPASKLSSETSSGRYQFWQAAINAYKSDPVHGIGAGEFESYWNRNGTLNTTIRHAHSLFLETLAELGIAGLLLVLGFLGSGLVAGWRRWRANADRSELGIALAILVAGIVSAALEWTWYLTATFVPVIVAVALLTGSATRPALPAWKNGNGNGNGASPPSSARRGRFGWGVATLLIGWASILAALSLLLTAARLSDSQADARNRDYPAAADAAEDAETLQPWSSEPRLQLALVYEAEGRLNLARMTLNEAIARAPYDYRLYIVAARIDAARGLPRAAHNELNIAETWTRQPDLIAAQKHQILQGEVPR